MSNQDNFKSRIISSQKPVGRRKRGTRKGSGHYSIDLMELHRRFAEAKERRKPIESRWIKVVIILIAVPSFFLLGYLIAALSVPTWVKGLLVIPVAIMGFILSYIVATLFH